MLAILRQKMSYNVDSEKRHFAFKYCHWVIKTENMELKNVDNGEHKCLKSNV